MVLNRVVWIVVAVLLIAVAFTGGVVLASRNAQRVAYLGSGVGPGTMRGNVPVPGAVAPNVPNSRTAPNGFGQMGPGMMGRGNGYNMMPGRRGVAPGFRAPNPGNNRNGVVPRRQMTPPGNQVAPNPKNNNRGVAPGRGNGNGRRGNNR